MEGTDINYTYTVTDSEGQGGGTAQTYDYLPMPVGNYDNVKFNLLNENYTFGLSGGGTRDYLEIDVHVVAQGSQRAYLASAWPKSDQNFVYTGEGVLPVEGTLNAYTDNSTSSDPVDIGTFTVNIGIGRTEDQFSCNIISEVVGNIEFRHHCVGIFQAGTRNFIHMAFVFCDDAKRTYTNLPRAERYGKRFRYLRFNRCDNRICGQCRLHSDCGESSCSKKSTCMTICREDSHVCFP